jgi:hypothetical protein
MPILNDIMDHEVIGPLIRQGRQEGRQDVLHRQLEKRFGHLPAWVETHLKSLPGADLDDLAVRILDAHRLEELFPQRP